MLTTIDGGGRTLMRLIDNHAHLPSTTCDGGGGRWRPNYVQIRQGGGARDPDAGFTSVRDVSGRCSG